MQGKCLMSINLFFVPQLDKNLLYINEIMKHNPHLNVMFNNNKCYIVNKLSKKLVIIGVSNLLGEC